MLVQPVNNCQNNYYNNSFKAQIIKTECLQKGLNHVKHKSLSTQFVFLIFLEHIKKDKDIKFFRVFNENINGKDLTKIEADGQVIYTDSHDEISLDAYIEDEKGRSILTAGGQCVSAIENFIETNYGRKLYGLMHKANKKLRRASKLQSKMTHANTEQEAQTYKLQLDAEQEKLRNELAKRYSSFEADLVELNEVMN